MGDIKAVGSVLKKFKIWLGRFEASLAFRIEVNIFDHVPEVEYIISNVNCFIFLQICKTLIQFKNSASNFPLYILSGLYFYLICIPG